MYGNEEIYRASESHPSSLGDRRVVFPCKVETSAEWSVMTSKGYSSTYWGSFVSAQTRAAHSSSLAAQLRSDLEGVNALDKKKMGLSTLLASTW